MDAARLERLIEMGRDLVAELDLETLLMRVVEAARELTGARYGALGVLSETGAGLERFLTSGIDQETHRAIGDLPRGRGVLGLLIDDPRPLRLTDVGRHAKSYGFPPAHPPMRTFLGVPILVRGEAWGNLYLTEKADGAAFDEDDEAAAVVLATWAGVAIQNARMYHSERDRRRELEQAVEGLRTATAISRALAGETNLDRVLELIVKRGRALVQARIMVAGLIAGDAVEVVTAAGEVDRSVLGVRIPLDGTVSGHAVRKQEAVRLKDVREQLHFTLAEHIEVESGLYVPLVFRGRSLGVLTAFDRLSERPEFGPHDEQLMLSFAASAATAVATAQNVAEERLRHALESAEHERRRWARELHDQTLQELAGLRMLLAGARRRGEPQRMEQAIDEAIGRITEEIGDLRALITDLRPAALDELGVGTALRRLVERVRDRSGLRVEAEIELAHERDAATPRLDPALETTLYRVVQEALTNAVKHAAATQVELRLVEEEERVTVLVRDDGHGFDPAASHDGFGLSGMRERVALVGGTLDLYATPAGGTTIRAVLPAAPVAAPRAVSTRAG